ncbi:MAG: hypothetical protein ACO1NX_09200 [Chitinophagaceae bacterium]
MKQLLFIITLLTATNCFAQTERKISTMLSMQGNRTVYDRTATNNAGGIGFGLQTRINTKSIIRPVAEINADLFVGTKEMYMTEDDKPIDAKSGVLSIYAGGLLRTSTRLALATTGGISFFNSKGYFGLRPSISYHLSRDGSVSAKASFTHIFHRDEISKEPFGYASIALGIRLF